MLEGFAGKFDLKPKQMLLATALISALMQAMGEGV